MTTRITTLFGIEIPIIQAGMVWVGGWKLASAVSEAGGLGLIGAGSMKPDLLRQHIEKCRAATDRPFGVNIPLLRGDASELISASLDSGVRIVFTSAGNPATHIDRLKASNSIVVHVVPSVRHARKASSVGCDAIVAEGFEAGGHNGLDEITTLALIPQVCDVVTCPVIAAGGIADGRGMAAAMALGADGVQVGTRFVATIESSAHPIFKQAIVDAGDDATILTLRSLAPVRLLKTPFALRAQEAERRGADTEELTALLGKKREMLGMFEGDVEEGEFEAGQGAGLISDLKPAAEVMTSMMREYRAAVTRLDELDNPARQSDPDW